MGAGECVCVCVREGGSLYYFLCMNLKRMNIIISCNTGNKINSHCDLIGHSEVSTSSQALDSSSTLTMLAHGMLQPRAFGLLKCIETLDSVSNYYLIGWVGDPRPGVVCKPRFEWGSILSGRGPRNLGSLDRGVQSYCDIVTVSLVFVCITRRSGYASDCVLNSTLYCFATSVTLIL